MPSKKIRTEYEVDERGELRIEVIDGESFYIAVLYSGDEFLERRLVPVKDGNINKDTIGKHDAR